MPLVPLQSEFIRSTLERDPGRESLNRKIIPGGKLSAQEALAVYQRAYAARLTEALGETFAAVHWALGDDRFFAHADFYIQKNPSPFYNLSDYGARFPDYLSGTPDADALPFLAELARFEWEFKNLFHEPDVSAPETWIPSQAPVRFSTSTRLLSHRHSAYAVWRRRGEKSAGFAETWMRPERLFLFKSQSDITVVALDEPEFQVIKSLRDGAELGAGLATATSRYPNFGTDRIENLFQMLGRSQAAIIATPQGE